MDHWDRIPRTREWNPGADIVVAGNGAGLSGYALIEETFLGWRPKHVQVHEIVARDQGRRSPTWHGARAGSTTSASC